jgi:hypothetical protein
MTSDEKPAIPPVDVDAVARSLPATEREARVPGPYIWRWTDADGNEMSITDQVVSIQMRETAEVHTEQTLTESLNRMIATAREHIRPETMQMIEESREKHFRPIPLVMHEVPQAFIETYRRIQEITERRDRRALLELDAEQYHARLREGSRPVVDDLQPRPQETYREAMNRLQQVDPSVIYGSAPAELLRSMIMNGPASEDDDERWGSLQDLSEEPGGDSMTRYKGDHFKKDGVW